jgi:DNA-binding winged helix-turn-helix (wHTH) protein
MVYYFYDCKLDTNGVELCRGGEPCPITLTQVKILQHIIENRARLVSRGELIEQFKIYGDQALTKTVARIRKAVGDDSRKQCVIKTIRYQVRGKEIIGEGGFRFVALLKEGEPVQEQPSRPSRRATRTRVGWGVPHGRDAGIIILNDGAFIRWEALKPDIDRLLIPQLQTSQGLNLPEGTRAELASLPGKPPGWFVELRSPEPENIMLGHIWFGKDPDRGWIEDGNVRVGDAAGTTAPGRFIVWQTYARYSDGTYRRIETPRQSTPQP